MAWNDCDDNVNVNKLYVNKHVNIDNINYSLKGVCLLRALHNPKKSNAPVQVIYDKRVLELPVGSSFLFEDDEVDFLIDRYPWLVEITAQSKLEKLEKRPDKRPTKAEAPRMEDELLTPTAEGEPTAMSDIQQEVSGPDFYGAGVEEDSV